MVVIDIHGLFLSGSLAGNNSRLFILFAGEQFDQNVLLEMFEVYLPFFQFPFFSTVMKSLQVLRCAEFYGALCNLADNLGTAFA